MIEIKAFEDGNELQVAEIDYIDSADPDCYALTVYVFKGETR